MGLLDLFSKKETETTDTQNDAERWVTDTYALWSEYAGGSWRQIGGYHKNRADAGMMRGVLRRDWDIKGREDGLEMVEYLIEPQRHQKSEDAAWDYCRATQLLGMFYITGYIDREELMEYSCRIAREMQTAYHSWEELCNAYMHGHAQWCRSQCAPEEADILIKERRAIYKRLCSMSDGPYHLPWNMKL